MPAMLDSFKKDAHRWDDRSEVDPILNLADPTLKLVQPSVQLLSRASGHDLRCNHNNGKHY